MIKNLKFTNVIFLDDLFRSDFLNARKFIYSLIEEPIKYALKIEDLKLSDYPLIRGFKSDFCENKFIGLANKKWNENYNYISDEAWSYLKSHLDNESLIVGYEMPSWLNSRLTRDNIKHVNIRLSPIRFARDLMFVVETNLPIDNTKKWSVSYEQLKFEAGLVRAKIRHDEKGVSITDGLIFLAQTHDDASIISLDNKFLTVLDFKQKINELSKNKKIYYKPHPYSWMNSKKEISLLKTIVGYSPEVVKDNIYNLMAADNNLSFFGISSGALQEAEFFDKSINFLYKPICNFNDKSLCHCTSNDFVSFNFWLNLLNVSDVDEIHIKNMDDSMMRHLHNAWWGYSEYLQDNSTFFHSFVKINKPKSRISRWIRRFI